MDYRLIKELWAFTDNRIAVRFAYGWHDDSGHWYRSYGNENWEFNEDGLMAARFASINDLPISEQIANITGSSAAVRTTIKD
jgi:nuclear transport factor 2 (NTF2) superfamily protein